VRHLKIGAKLTEIEQNKKFHQNLQGKMSKI